MKALYMKIILHLTLFSSVFSFQVSLSPYVDTERHLIDSEKICLFNSASSSSNNSTTGRRIFFQRVFLLFASLMMFPPGALSMSQEQTCSEVRKVIVIGANGQTGFRIINLLHKSAQFQPVAMIRDLSQSSKFDEMGVPYFIHDLDSSSIPVNSLEGAYTVIFAAGAGRSRPPIKNVTIDYLGAVQSIVASQETKSVKRFILLSGINSDPLGTRRSVGSTDLSGPLSTWHRLKAHSETYLKESHLHGRTIDWTILCPGRLVDDLHQSGTRKVKCSLIHGEDDLKRSLTDEERKAAVKIMPGSHDGKSERLCISRDNTAATLVGLLSAVNTIGKSITVVDGILPVDEAISVI